MSKNLNKILVLFIKFYPIVISIGYFVNILLHYFDIEYLLIDYTILHSISSIMFLYICSAVFSFCLYHRIFIHYILIQDILSYYDNVYTIPVSDKQFLYIQMSLLFIVLVIALRNYIKKKELKILV